MYEIRFTGAVEKYLKRIKEKGLKKEFQLALEEISSNPYIGELKTGDLMGVYCYDVYYNKTNYELAYKIYDEDGQLVVVILGRHFIFYITLLSFFK